MSLTPAQQQLADVAQAGEANACCLALGGEIGNYPVTGEELCLMPGAMSFPLGESCGQITASLPSEPSPGQESGGFWNWLGSNFTQVTDGAANIIDAIQGNQPAPPPQIAGSGVTTTPPPSNNGQKVLYVVGGLVLLVVVIMLIRKKK